MIWCLQYWRESFWNTFSQITLIQLELNSFTRAAGLYISTYLCLEFAYDGYCLSCTDHWAEKNTSALPCPSQQSEGTCNLLCVSIMKSSEMATAYGLAWGSMQSSSESFRVIIVSVKGCRGCGQQTGSKLRKAVSWGCTLGMGHYCWTSP